MDPKLLATLLWGKRFLILGTAAVVSVAGLLFILSRPLPAGVRTVIEIGYKGAALVDDVDAIRQKIENIYSLTAAKEMSNVSPPIGFDLRVRTTRNSNVVFLESAVLPNQLAQYQTFHTKIVEQMMLEHERTFDPIKTALVSQREDRVEALRRLETSLTAEKEISTEISNVEAEMARLRDDRIFGLAEKQQERAIAIAAKTYADLKGDMLVLAESRRAQDALVDLYTKDIQNLSALIEQTNKSATERPRSAEDANRDAERLRAELELLRMKRSALVDIPLEQTKTADTTLELQRQLPIQERAVAIAQAELDKLRLERDQKLATLTSRADTLRTKLSDLASNRAASSAQKAKIEEVESMIRNLRVTRIAVPPAEFKAREPSKLVLSILAVLAGLGIGLLAGVLAIFREFIDQRSNQQAHLDNV